ncbi:MAG: hypothetical protein IAE77_12340 [Prosthecobacter sp.]|jgi:hypothetical protein|uniref:SLBB domain-containing protein n=1 Tax=Prosthecobacter sp. TaxID=1965333 RepID=UPI0019E63162|nr:SLBB domain-containing protein [Prosthecobacter sp.]MBE2284237.1 hypothetical protein [Prosthecobacter sp.]
MATKKGALLVSVAALCLTDCCRDFVPRDQLPTYGDPVPGTIHVVAISGGFKRPGHYHLPKGATLGLLIDVAGGKPVPADVPKIELAGILFRRGAEHFLLVKNHYKNQKGRAESEEIISHLDKNGMPFQHRERLLLDGDEVWRSGISF